MVTMRRLDLILRVRLRVMIFQKMRVNQRYGGAMIIVIMGVEQRRGDQRGKHRDHAKICAKTLHGADCPVPVARKSIGGSARSGQDWREKGFGQYGLFVLSSTAL